MRNAAVMLVINDGLILAISRRYDKTKFGLIGGKVDEGETIEQAAIREAKEEAGITVNSCSYVYTRFEPRDKPDGEDFQTHCYYATDWEGNPTDSEEGLVRWLTVSQLTSSEMGAFPEYNKLCLQKFSEIYSSIEIK